MTETKYLLKPTDYPDMCPKCGSEDISKDDDYPDGNQHTDEIHCNNPDCYFVWFEYYTYKGWEPRGY